MVGMLGTSRTFFHDSGFSFWFQVLPSVPTLTSLPNGPQTLSWNKTFPPRVDFVYSVYPNNRKQTKTLVSLYYVNHITLFITYLDTFTCNGSLAFLHNWIIYNMVHIFGFCLKYLKVERLKMLAGLVSIDDQLLKLFYPLLVLVVCI